MAGKAKSIARKDDMPADYAYIYVKNLEPVPLTGDTAVVGEPF
jgi:hypothetical protein